MADLLDKLLVHNPETRLTADQALDHDWFWTEPFPADPGSINLFPSSHEYDKRKASEEMAGGEENFLALLAAFREPNQLVKATDVVQAPYPQSLVPQKRLMQQQQAMQQQQPHHQNWTRAAVPAALPQNRRPMTLPASLPRPPHLIQKPPVQHYQQPPAYPNIGYPITNGNMGQSLPFQRPLPNLGYQQLAGNPHGNTGPLPPRPVHAAGGAKLRFGDMVASASGNRNNGWEQPDQGYKRRNSPPRKIAGVSKSRPIHADAFGGQENGPPDLRAGSKQTIRSYKDVDEVPAGGTEPLDY